MLDDIITRILENKEVTLEVNITQIIMYGRYYFLTGHIQYIGGCEIMPRAIGVMTTPNKIIPGREEFDFSTVTGYVLTGEQENELIDKMRLLGPCGIEIIGQPTISIGAQNIGTETVMSPDYWERWSSDRTLSEYIEKIHPTIIGECTVQNPKNILDVACGEGSLLARLKERYPKANLYGVDFSKANIAAARVKEVADILNGDARALGDVVPSGLMFDLITCSGLLSNQVMVDKADRDKVLDAMVARLNPGGQLIITSLAQPLITSEDLTKRGLVVTRYCFPERLFTREKPVPFYTAYKPAA